MTSLAARPAPTVDPYRDLDVIDARGPRTLQSFVAVFTLVALATGFWPLVAVMAVQLVAGLVFGRTACLPCRLWFDVLQPRFGEGRIEDSRPPRFANILGATFLSVATVAFLAGAPLVGWVLAGIVALLATLASTTGFCVGCVFYKRVWGCETC